MSDDLLQSLYDERKKNDGRNIWLALAVIPIVAVVLFSTDIGNRILAIRPPAR
jgi:hypothetical protein